MSDQETTNKTQEHPSSSPGSKPESEQGSTANNSPAKKENAASPVKIQLLLRPVGDAPIAKNQKWNVEKTHTIAWVAEFFRKYLKLDEKQQKTLVFFVNQCFAPSPDETLENLYECFGSDGKLVLHYCLTMAWG